MSGPRVTVPVEPTENMIEAGRRAGCIGSSVAGLVYDAMLSAAPAPEGGAVLEDAEDRFEQYVKAAIDGTPEPLKKLGEFLTTVLDEDHWATAERYLLALATREEAPAPTCQRCGGEIAGWCCQNCPAEFRENDDGVLVFDEEEAPAEAGEDDGLFLLMKRGLYYRPNAMGYTGIKDHAGRYTKTEADSHADDPSGVTAIAVVDAPDFSPACYDDLARAHLAGKLEQATRELAALRAQPPAREEVGCAELEVGRAVYERIEKLIETDPRGAELDYLSHLVESVEEVGGYDGPPAREDAQPVAWRYRTGRAEEHWRLSATEVYADQSWGVEQQPLFTHPASDALRAAVEALEPFARAADRLDSHWSDDDWRWNDSVRSGVTVRDIRRARQAHAAALQAEQGAK